jgi:hypothetical protein
LDQLQQLKITCWQAWHATTTQQIGHECPTIKRKLSWSSLKQMGHSSQATSMITFLRFVGDHCMPPLPHHHPRTTQNLAPAIHQRDTMTIMPFSSARTSLIDAPRHVVTMFYSEFHVLPPGSRTIRGHVE